MNRSGATVAKSMALRVPMGGGSSGHQYSITIERFHGGFNLTTSQYVGREASEDLSILALEDKLVLLVTSQDVVTGNS